VIYLIGEIVLYLIAALLLGVGAGWLLRGVRLRTAVHRAAAVPSFAEPAPAPIVDTGRIADLEAELAEARARGLEWQTQSAARGVELQSLSRRLSALARQVEELQKERALQTRALQVLHQQLELALERGEPRKVRATGTAA
jgi:TolA-binding protein